MTPRTSRTTHTHITHITRLLFLRYDRFPLAAKENVTAEHRGIWGLSKCTPGEFIGFKIEGAVSSIWVNYTVYDDSGMNPSGGRYALSPSFNIYIFINNILFLLLLLLLIFTLSRTMLRIMALVLWVLTDGRAHANTKVVNHAVGWPKRG